MRQLLIGDCHFGRHSNSVIWLENQLKFFNTQFIEALNTKEVNRVVFLGDLFDIRYSINQQVGIEVKNFIRKILEDYPNIEFFMIAGNHDFYSPLEEFHEYNCYNLIFGDEFIKIHKNLKIIDNQPYMDDKQNLYLPWYYTENFKNFSDILYSIDGKINNIFCHDDLSKWEYSRIVSLHDANVWAGHIHNIIEFENPCLHNVGSMFAFDFNDVNSKKYMFLIDDTSLVEKIENTTTPRFKRYFNEDIFILKEEDFKNAYVQICIFNTNVNKARYIERIKEIKTNFAEYNVRIQVIDNAIGESIEISYFNANIDQYIEENVPQYLNEKYLLVKDKIKNDKENI